MDFFLLLSRSVFHCRFNSIGKERMYFLQPLTKPPNVDTFVISFSCFRLRGLWQFTLMNSFESSGKAIRYLLRKQTSIKMWILSESMKNQMPDKNSHWQFTIFVRMRREHNGYQHRESNQQKLLRKRDEFIYSG